ncbi:MAG: SMC-Scp complex subunit ScpB, partial [Deltaproteobacteria bacterium]
MLDKLSLKPVIEALVFAAEAPLTIERMAGVLEGEDKAAIKEALAEVIAEYKERAGGLYIEEVAGGYIFRTNPEFAPHLRRLFKIGLQKISKAAMETLAVIAYKQPVTRVELEAIRGVDSGGVLATLMEKRFIKVVGRKEVPGRPVVYGTTKEFLETFDLKDLSCLPSLKDIQRMEEENAAENPERSKDTIEDSIQINPEDEAVIQDGVQEGASAPTEEELPDRDTTWGRDKDGLEGIETGETCPDETELEDAIEDGDNVGLEDLETGETCPDETELEDAIE